MFRVFLFLTAVIFFLLPGCVTQKGQAVLNMFFDGIPETEPIEQVQSTDSLTSDQTKQKDSSTLSTTTPSPVIHYPFLENDCTTCHDANAVGSLVEPEPGLCYQCHIDFKEEYNFLHGPVGGGYCTACHDPHRSDTEKLLKRSGKYLCDYCHNECSSFNYEVHDGLEELNCIDCHNPHGGPDRSLLK